MPTQITEKSLLEIAHKVLEFYTFNYSENPPNNIMIKETDVLSAEVSFAGRYPGSLTLSAPRKTLVELTASMIGLEPGPELPPVDLQQDVLGELTNVICGNFLTKYKDLIQPRGMNVPRVFIDRLGPLKTPTRLKQKLILVMIEENWLAVKLNLDNSVLENR